MQCAWRNLAAWVNKCSDILRSAWPTCQSPPKLNQWSLAVIWPYYTSGHDYLDAERASCPMNIHWNTVWSNRQSQGAFPLFLYSVLWQFQFHLKFHVSRSGVRIPVKIIFSLFFPFPNFLQRSINGEYFLNTFYWLIDWLINMSCHSSHITKSCLDWDSNPRPGNVELPQYAVEERGKALYDCLLLDTVFQWVFIRQLALSASR